MSTTKQLLSLSEAARQLPHRPHASSLWRWARIGLQARNGTIIRLEHQRLGRRIFVTREALEKFGQDLAEADVEVQ